MTSTSGLITSDPTNSSGQVQIVGSPFPIANGLWGTCSYGYNPLVFRTVPVGLAKSFPDGTSQTVMFSEKLQLCGSGSAMIQNYWFGSHAGNSAAGDRSPVMPGAELLTPSTYRTDCAPGRHGRGQPESSKRRDTESTDAHSD